MTNKAFEISEAELEVMKVLWKNKGPMALQGICDALITKEWKYTTISTLLSRLVEKGAVQYDKKGKTNYYFSNIKEEDYKQLQTKTLVSKLYDGSVKKLAVSLFKNGELSKADIDEIKEMFDL